MVYRNSSSIGETERENSVQLTMLVVASTRERVYLRGDGELLFQGNIKISDHRGESKMGKGRC